MRTRVSTFIGMVLVLTSLLVAGNTAPASAAWTPYPTDYATDKHTPRFAVCEISEGKKRITLKVRATRPTQKAVSFAANWNWKKDYSGKGGGVFQDNWSNNKAFARITLPKAAFWTLGWQTNAAGYGYSKTKRPPLDAKSCA